MKNTKIMFAKSLGFMGLIALVLGAFLVPSYKANAQVVMGWGSLISSPDTICSGGTQNATLSWDSSNATTLNISPSVGSVAPTGSRNVSPAQTTTYTLTLSNSTGWTGTATAVVYVTGPCTTTSTPLPTVSISANPSSIAYGDSGVVTWSSANATSCTATSGSNGWSGLKATAGTFGTGSLTNTTSYGITCTNSAGQSANASATVNVSGQLQNPLPTVSIYANPSSINSGDSSTITWSSANATSCNATGGLNGWSGLKATSGSFYTGALYGYTTFGITCTSSTGQSATASATVFVTSNQIINNPSVTTYSATNITTNGATLNGYVTGGSSSTNAWFQWGTSYSNLFSSTPQQYYGSGSSNFSAPIFGLSPNTTYYFRAVAQGTSGIIYGSVLSFTTTGTIVIPVFNQTSVNLTADSTNLAYNGATFIRWNSANASSCVASGGSLGWAGTKSTGPASFYTGAMNTSSTFIITCTGIYGSATDSVTVTVRPQVITGTPAPVSNRSSLLIVTSSVDRTQAIVPTIDNTMPRPGDEINYTITYRNVGNASLTNLNLQIVLPAEVDYMFSTPSNPSVFGQTLMFNLGTLRANTEGEVTVRVRVRDNIAPGTILNFPATLTYTDANGQAQSVNANVTAEVFRDGESQGLFLGANVFGAGFLPDNLFGWLLLIILILLLVLLAKYLFGRADNNKYVLAQTPSPIAPFGPNTNYEQTTHTTTTNH